LIERLGVGSLGVVHRALDLATGREVALKIMPLAGGATNLRGEFVALARLRHPNIVSVLDYGLTDAGDEYFTMELVAGPALTAAVGPVTAQRMWALLGGVLEALAAVHGAGVVHADLKPSNILVDGAALLHAPGRAARLADFGLATPLADPAAPPPGTIGYAAPEAWSGRIDARADLYSFGVVLWQLVMGARPFGGATPRAVVAAQRAGHPGDPRKLRPELPPALAELMLALIDPAPGARPESAEEVLDRWRAIADGLGYPAIAARASGGRVTRRAAALPTLVGRDRELVELDRAWAEAKLGRGAPVVITGEPGIGKSRLLAELALQLQLDGGEVVRLSARASDGPWAPLRALARTLITIAGPAWARAGSAAAPHVAALLDHIASLGAGRWVLAEAVVELVAATAAVRPLAILVDDADAAPPAVADVLAYLVRAVPDLAVLLVVAGRAPEPSARPVAAPLDAAVAVAERGRRLELVPLGQSSVFALVIAAVGAEVASRVADELRRVSRQPRPRDRHARRDDRTPARSPATAGAGPPPPS
jgi:serine/threonine-protein kinase